MDKLDNELLEKVANSLNLEPALLKAVKLVESGDRDGFLPSGRPQILFEGHIMFSKLKKKYGQEFAEQKAKEFPNVVYKSWTKSKYKGGEREWERLYIAMDIDKELAYESTSWGMFQVMGFNYELCSCVHVCEFVSKMSASHEGQLRLTYQFMRNSGCIKYLKMHDWRNFASLYNGSGYKKNNYHIKMEKAYEKFKEEEQKA